MARISLGCEVLTPVGWGIVVSEKANFLVVSLDWKLTTGSATAFVNPETISLRSFCAIGSCALTRFGPCIVIDFNKKTCMHVVKLWTSYGLASATAWLSFDQFIHEIKCLPGIECLTAYGMGTVIHFIPTNHLFVVELTYGTAYIQPSCILSSQARFLPSVIYLSTETRKVWLEKWRRITDANSNGQIWSSIERLWSSVSSSKSADDVINDRFQAMNSMSASDDQMKDFANRALSRMKQLMNDRPGDRVGLEASYNQLKDFASESWNSLNSPLVQANFQLVLSNISLTAKQDDDLKLIMDEFQQYWDDINIAGHRLADSKTGSLLVSTSSSLSHRLSSLSNQESAKSVISMGSKIIDKLTDPNASGSKKLTEVWLTAKKRLATKLIDDDGDGGDLESSLIRMLKAWTDENVNMSDQMGKLTVLLEMMSGSSSSSSSSSSSISLFVTSRLLTALESVILAEEKGTTCDDDDDDDRFKDKSRGYLTFLKPIRHQIAKSFLLLDDDYDDDGLTGIISHAIDGDVSFSQALDQTVVELNDNDEVHSNVESLLESTESIVSYLEQLTQNSTIKSTISVLKSMNIDDRIMTKIDEINANEIVDLTEKSLSDADVRHALVSKMKDSCISFLLEILPGIHVPDVEGVKDGTEYVVSNLDLSGFRIHQENVDVRLADSLAQDLFSVKISHVSALLKQLHWKYKQRHFPYMRGDGIADATIESGFMEFGFKIVRVPRDGGWKPCLMITKMNVVIGQLDLLVDGSSLSWLYNILASVFASVIKNYVSRNVLESMAINIVQLLSFVNGFLTPKYWSIILNMVGSNIDNIPIATESETIKLKEAQLLLEKKRLQDIECEMMKHNTKTSNEDGDVELELTFKNQEPLGMHVTIMEYRLPKPNDTPIRKLKISSVVAGGQAESLIATDGIDGSLVGATVIQVNHLRSYDVSAVDLMTEITSGVRPISIVVKMDKPKHKQQQSSSWIGLTLHPGPLGIRLKEVKSCGGAAVVIGFSRAADGSMQQLEASGVVTIGMILVSVRDVIAFGKPFDFVVRLLQSTSRPANAVFAKSPDVQLKMTSAPIDLLLTQVGEFVVVAGFNDLKGCVEASHVVYARDKLVAINGEPIEISSDLSSLSSSKMSILIERYITNKPMLDGCNHLLLTFLCQSSGIHQIELPVNQPSGVMWLLDDNGCIVVSAFESMPCLSQITCVAGIEGPAKMMRQIVPGMILLQIDDTPVVKSLTADNCTAMIKALPPNSRHKYYFRDMNSFLKLIQLREMQDAAASKKEIELNGEDTTLESKTGSNDDDQTIEQAVLPENAE